MMPLSSDPLQGFVSCLETGEWDKNFPFCMPDCPPNAKADVVFLIDSSTSMTGTSLVTLRTFLREMIGQWTISSQFVNVAIVPYHTEIAFDDVIFLPQFANNKDGLLASLEVITNNRPGSLTGNALEYARSVVLSAENGNRPDAPDIVIVMTDGRGQDSIDVPLQRLWAVGATTYAVGCNPRQRLSMLTPQLMKIAQNNSERMHLTDRSSMGNIDVMMHDMKNVYCPPDDFCTPPRRSLKNGVVRCTDENRVSSVCTFECDAGYTVYPRNVVTNRCLPSKNWNRRAPCCTRPCPPNAKMDAFVILDSSSSVGDDNWKIMKRFIRDILGSFTIADDATHFAVVRYNRFVDTTTQIQLNDYPNDRDALLSAFDAIPYDGSGTRTGQAIQHVVDNMVPVGNRPDVQDIAIVVTDGKSQDNVLEQSKQLRDSGAFVFVIGINPPKGKLDEGQLREIAGNPDNVLIAKGGFEALNAEFSLQITDKVCGNPCDR
uniref:collagen alpha-1(XII) chain-like n=1 Tax=Styela clava TaxID=7725 RepID=UPI0019394661|nr:collagen alpha-1(XII) chain-like [Styela clava]